MPVKNSSNPAPRKDTNEKKDYKTALGVVVSLLEWDVEVTRHGDNYCQVKITQENGLTYFGTVFGQTAKDLVAGKFKANELYFELRREEYNGVWRDKLVCQGN